MRMWARWDRFVFEQIRYRYLKSKYRFLCVAYGINKVNRQLNHFFPWIGSSSGLRPTKCWYLEITPRHTTLGRTPLDEGSSQRRDLYPTMHNIHKRKTSMPPARFEPAIPASERSQIHTLDRAATGIGWAIGTRTYFLHWNCYLDIKKL
jgi:hypothetical protein